MKEIISKRKEISKISRLEAMAPSQIRREMLLKGVEGEIKELNIIIKANTHGSAEAVSSSLQQLESKKIYIKVVHLGIGDISEADMILKCRLLNEPPLVSQYTRSLHHHAGR